MSTFVTDLKVGLEDIRYLLFGKKVCPKCRGALKRRWHSVPKGQVWDVNVWGLKLDATYADKTEVFLTYGCVPCDKTWRARDLWKSREV